MGECWPLMSGLVSTQHPALPTPAVWQVILKKLGGHSQPLLGSFTPGALQVPHCQGLGRGK